MKIIFIICLFLFKTFVSCDDITQNWFNQANSFKVLSNPTISKPVGSIASDINEVEGIINNGL